MPVRSFHRRAAILLALGMPLAHGRLVQAAADGPQAQNAQPPQAQSIPAPQPPQAAAAAADQGITEEQIRQLLVGKPLFLRGGYLADRLNFDADGALAGNSPRGSYTLCAVEIKTVHLTKRKLELTGERYGLHFLGALAYEDAANAFDRVQLTSGKRMLTVTIDREETAEPRRFGIFPFLSKPEPNADAPKSTNTGVSGNRAAPSGNQPANSNQPANGATGTSTAPAAQAQADRNLEKALDRIFAQGIDDRLIASMPAFWQLYYAAAAAKADYRPQDSSVLRQNTVDRKAQLLTNVVPPSNQYAQDHDVSGMALYQVVVGADGRAGEIAVARPIGFGLDENAIAAIRQAKFDPAVKDSRPVPVLLNLVVEFRIYSNRTATTEKPEAAQPSAPVLPGPYSVQHP